MNCFSAASQSFKQGNLVVKQIHIYYCFLLFLEDGSFLALGGQVVHVGFGFSELHLVHTFSLSLVRSICAIETDRELLFSVPRNLRRHTWRQPAVLHFLLQSRQSTLHARSMASSQEKDHLLPKPLHSRAIQYSLDNLIHEPAG